MNLHVEPEPDGYSFRLLVIDEPENRMTEVRHLNSSQLYDVCQIIKIAALTAARDGQTMVFEVSSEGLPKEGLARTLLLKLSDEIVSLTTRRPPEG